MAAKSVEGNKGKKPASAAVNLIGMMTLLWCMDTSLAVMLTCDTAGGGAGMMEALVCHPLGKAIIQRYRVLKAELTISQIPSKSECSSRDGLWPLG